MTAPARETLVGFAVIYLHRPMQASGCITAYNEALFVDKAARQQGAGKALLCAVEDCASENGAGSLYLSAPSGSRLQSILPRIGFVETARIFTKTL